MKNEKIKKKTKMSSTRLSIELEPYLKDFAATPQSKKDVQSWRLAAIARIVHQHKEGARVRMKNLDNFIDLCEEAYDNACVHGFHPAFEKEDDFVKAMCNNLHDEVSELHGAWRDGHLHSFCEKAGEMVALGLPPLTNLEEELADVVIRCMDNAENLHVSLLYAINVKMAYNRTRPFRHGDKKS